MQRRIPVVLVGILVLAGSSFAAKKKATSQPVEEQPTTLATKGIFRPLPIEGSVHTISCTEDGKYLLEHV